MDPTSLNTLVGIIGTVVGIIGIVTGSIGIYSLKTVNKITNKTTNRMKVKKTKGTVQQAEIIEIVNNGASYQDIEYMADKNSSEKIRKLTKVADIERLVEKDPRYVIPLLWRGTEKEYEELIKENKIVDNAQYALYEE